MRIVRGIAALMMAVVLAACGGGGGQAGTPPFAVGGDGGVTPPSAAASVEVVASSNQGGTAGEQVTITAIVKSAANVNLAATPVSFSTTSGNLSDASAVTDASGVATAKLSAGADKSNRSATVTVTSGGASGNVLIDFTGTKIAYSGPTTLQFGQAATLAIKATDSAGTVIADLPITVTSSLNNGLSSSSIVTDAQGNASLSYTATNAGSDIVQFAGAGATTAPSIQISGEDFSITSPAANQTVAIGSSTPISARYLVNGVPASGNFAIRFAATAGTVTPAAASTGIALSGGAASATVSSTFAGPVTIQATLFNTSTNAVVAQAAVPIQFVATVPNAVVVQITPTSIGPNVAGSTARQAQVRATVTDPSGNPVQGATVNFSKDADPSGGNLSQASAVTDSNGQATVQYISGATTSSSDGVRLRGTVAGSTPAITSTATMTVNQSALFIALGTGNVISNLNETTYRKTWTVYVTDASGAAVPSQLLTISVLPTRYRKGSFVLAGDEYVQGAWNGVSLTPDGTLPAGAYITCANEDVDYSGTVSVAKDVNTSGRLEPGNVISVNGGANVTTITTDATGFALLNLQYAESYAYWVEVTLKASATVAGTESSNQSTFWAIGAKADYTEGGGPPAGLVSPFGENPSCLTAN